VSCGKAVKTWQGRWSREAAMARIAVAGTSLARDTCRPMNDQLTQDFT
jgi:hypothetical protein